MTIIACVKNKRTSSLPQNLSLVAVLFKDKRDLANHPLSCLLRGCLASEKVRENERKKTGGRAEGFHAQKLLHQVILLYKALTEPISYSEQGKLQKFMNYQKYIEGSLGKSYKKLVKK